MPPLAPVTRTVRPLKLDKRITFAFLLMRPRPDVGVGWVGHEDRTEKAPSITGDTGWLIWFDTGDMRP